MYFIITYKEYCKAMGENYDGNTPEWFLRIQNTAINTIRSEIVDVKIFPKNSGMLHQLKPQWINSVIEGIARQIYYTYNNEYFLLNGVFANRSYNQTQYGEGPVDKAAYDIAVSHACNPCRNSFIETGWFCKRMDVKFDKDKYYMKYDPSFKDINWGQIGGNLEDQFDLIQYLGDNYTMLNDFLAFKSVTNQSLNMIDTNIEALEIGKQDNLKGLATYGADKTLVTDSAGNIVWGASQAAIWGNITGNIHNQKDVQSKVIYSATDPALDPTKAIADGDVWVNDSVSTIKWGMLDGDILLQKDLQEVLGRKQNSINETNKLSYNYVMDLPVLSGKEIKGTLTLDDINVYDKVKVNQLIATMGGDYLGYNETPTTTDYKDPSKWEDATVKIYEILQPFGVTPKKNDWCYIVYKDPTDKILYQRWACSDETFVRAGVTYNKFQFLFELDIDITDLQAKVDQHTTQITGIQSTLLTKADKYQHISLDATEGTVTQAQLDLLQSNLLNYINTAQALGLRLIWWEGSTTTGYMVYAATYYDDQTPAKAWAHKLTIDIANKTYTNERKQLITDLDLTNETNARIAADAQLDTKINAIPVVSGTSQGDNWTTITIGGTTKNVGGGSALAAYPVGSIYISVNNVNPHELFGGNWEALPTNVYLVTGAYTGTTIGSNTHTLTTSEMPSHNHTLTIGNATGIVEGRSGWILGNNNNQGATLCPKTEGLFNYKGRGSGSTHHPCQLDTGKNWGNNTDFGIDITNHQHTGSISNSGSGQEFNIQPLSLQVYMWKRLPD